MGPDPREAMRREEAVANGVAQWSRFHKSGAARTGCTRRRAEGSGGTGCCVLAPLMLPSGTAAGPRRRRRCRGRGQLARRCGLWQCAVAGGARAAAGLAAQARACLRQCALTGVGAHTHEPSPLHAACPPCRLSLRRVRPARVRRMRRETRQHEQKRTACTSLLLCTQRRTGRGALLALSPPLRGVPHNVDRLYKVAEGRNLNLGAATGSVARIQFKYNSTAT